MPDGAKPAAPTGPGVENVESAPGEITCATAPTVAAALAGAGEDRFTTAAPTPGGESRFTIAGAAPPCVGPTGC